MKWLAPVAGPPVFLVPPGSLDAEIVTLCIAQAIMGIPSDPRFVLVANKRLRHLFPVLPARDAFHKRFWYAEGNYLYDVVDGENGDDHSLRPNQIFAISLDNPILDQEKWPSVMEAVKANLLTPLGLRSLAPSEKDYKPRYDGDLRSRDAAYHQGTVWPWLLGPFIDAWLKVHPRDSQSVAGFLSAFDSHLQDGAIGSIGEIFDAEPPYNQRGCVAQAWSVAEILRSYIKQKDAELHDERKADGGA